MSERRRIRFKVMAEELKISERKLRQLLTVGLPHTRVHGLIWCDPELVHQWLDKFNDSTGFTGVKRHRGMKLYKLGYNEQTVGWPRQLNIRPKPMVIGWGFPEFGIPEFY